MSGRRAAGLCNCDARIVGQLPARIKRRAAICGAASNADRSPRATGGIVVALG
jgi:hypothetical protein